MNPWAFTALALVLSASAAPTENAYAAFNGSMVDLVKCCDTTISGRMVRADNDTVTIDAIDGFRYVIGKHSITSVRALA